MLDGKAHFRLVIEQPGSIYYSFDRVLNGSMILSETAWYIVRKKKGECEDMMA